MVIDWAGKVTPFPEMDARRYRSAGLWGNAPIGAEFHAVAQRDPSRIAVVAEEGSLTYRDLDEQTDLLASGLADMGLRPGDRVIVQLTNQLESVIAWYGMLKAGLIPVCTLAAHRAHEIGAISRKVGAVAHLVEAGGNFDLTEFAVEMGADHPTLRHVLTSRAPVDAPGLRIEDLIIGADRATARGRVAAIQESIDADEVVCFQLSGGTTGVPKLIPRLHAEYWYNASAYAHARGWTAETRAAHMIPIIHNAGITCSLHAVHSVGGTLILTTAVLDQALPLLARERASEALVGHGHFSIIDHPEFAAAMATVDRVLLSGAKVPARVFEAFEAQGVWVGQTFGMGEGFFTMSTPHSSRLGRMTTVGEPMSAYDEFRVLEPGSETELPDGAVGELVTRGPYTIRGYFDAPSINSEAFTSDGFFRTGDLVAVRTIDGARALAVEGRLKDLINRGGEKISAAEVEELLLRHPRILAAAIVAMPDERLGERACAFLVSTDEPLTMHEVQDHLSKLSLAKFKWPERLEWVETLPRTPVGKIDKKALRSDVAARMLVSEGA